MLRDLTPDESRELARIACDATARDANSARDPDGPNAAEIARLRTENARLVRTLRGLRAWCMPGMGWTDEIGRALLAEADEVLAGGWMLPSGRASDDSEPQDR